MEITYKRKLKAGDLISYHDWTSGGFLFGVIIEYKDERYHSNLNIWRSPNSIHLLEAVDAIEVVRRIEDVEDYRLYDLQVFLNKIKENNIYCNFG